MEIQIVITQDGKLSIFSKQGTFLEGKEKIKLLLQTLEAEGVEFDSISDVEQHSHEKHEIPVRIKGSTK